MQACSRLLQRLVSSDTYTKCCPEKFDIQPKYKVKESELLVEGLESIRPRQELKAIKKLSSCGFFEKGASELIKNAYNRKFKNTIGKPSKEVNENFSDNSEDGVIEKQDSSSSGEESDPFDFITVQMLTSDEDIDI